MTNPTSEALKAAAALVAKLDECAPHIADAALHRQLRCGPYTGPNYGEELGALRVALGGRMKAADDASLPAEKAGEAEDKARELLADALDANDQTASANAVRLAKQGAEYFAIPVAVALRSIKAALAKSVRDAQPLQDALAIARHWFDAATDEEKEAMLHAQRASLKQSLRDLPENETSYAIVPPAPAADVEAPTIPASRRLREQVTLCSNPDCEVCEIATDAAAAIEKLTTERDHLATLYAELQESASAREAAAMFDRPSTEAKMLGELLARIHRDGGQYIEQHGLAKAVADADLIVAGMYADEARATALEEAARVAEQWITLTSFGKVGQAAIRQVVGAIRNLTPVSTPPTEALREALQTARDALHQHYVDWDGEPEDAVVLQLARAKCDAALSAPSRVGYWQIDGVGNRHWISTEGETVMLNPLPKGKNHDVA